MDSILLYIQIGIHACTIILVLIPTTTLVIAIIQVLFAITGICIKIIRETKRKKIKSLLKSQVEFYIPYLLTGVELRFLYLTNQQLP